MIPHQREEVTAAMNEELRKKFWQACEERKQYALSHSTILLTIKNMHDDMWITRFNALWEKVCRSAEGCWELERCRDKVQGCSDERLRTMFAEHSNDIYIRVIIQLQREMALAQARKDGYEDGRKDGEAAGNKRALTAIDELEDTKKRQKEEVKALKEKHKEEMRELKARQKEEMSEIEEKLKIAKADVRNKYWWRHAKSIATDKRDFRKDMLRFYWKLENETAVPIQEREAILEQIWNRSPIKKTLGCFLGKDGRFAYQSLAKTASDPKRRPETRYRPDELSVTISFGDDD